MSRVATSRFDHRDARVSGATPAALALYERALAAFVSWRSGADALLAQATEQAPGFVMAHALRAWMLAGGRDPRKLQAARNRLAAATALPANEHERQHLAALARVLADDHEGATTLLGGVLREHPRDLLALAMACGLDYLTGQAARMRDRVERVLPAWPPDLPGFHAVRAMHAFGLVECGENERAEDAALAALALDDGDARAHHAMAHVFEMSDRPDAGLRWMTAHARQWGTDTVVATHCGWHLALFHLARGEPGEALALYDRQIRAGQSTEVADLIDAAALLWRLQLKGIAVGARWSELATAWAPHIDDGYCSFSDMHAMLAFVGAHDESRSRQLEQALMRMQLQPTRHGVSTRQIGLPACRALMAYGRGDDALAIALLGSLPSRMHRLGGSHAQRDVLHLTLLQAIERMRRPGRATQHRKQDGMRLEARLPQPFPRLMTV